MNARAEPVGFDVGAVLVIAALVLMAALGFGFGLAFEPQVNAAARAAARPPVDAGAG